MRPLALLDPGIFSIPNAANNQAEAEAIIEQILDWAEVSDRQNCLHICIPEDTIDALCQENVFPAYHQVAAMLAMYDLDNVFSPQDVCARMTAILQRAEHIEDLRVERLADHDEASAVIGDLFASRYTQMPALGNKIKEAITLLGALKAFEPAWSALAWYVPPVPYTENVRLSGHVQATAVGSKETRTVPIDLRFPSPHTVSDFLCLLDPEAIWKFSTEAKQTHLAVVLQAAQINKRPIAPPIPPTELPRFVVGPYFLRSLAYCDAMKGTSARTALKCCAQVLTTGAEHDEAFSSVRRRDKAKSRRVHVNKAGKALRLMYWVLSDGSTEFANVGVKQELEIHEGEANRAESACV